MKKIIVSVLVFMAIFSVTTFVYASAKKQITNQPSVNATAVTRFEQNLIYRIREYSTFEKNMPTDISSTDQSLLTGELSQSVATTKTALSNLKNAVSGADYNKIVAQTNTSSEALLGVKMSLLRIAFPPINQNISPLSSDNATSSESLQLRSVPLIPSPTTNVPSDVIDEIINLNSFANIGALTKEVITDSLSSTTPATTSIPLEIN